MQYREIEWERESNTERVSEWERETERERERDGRKEKRDNFLPSHSGSKFTLLFLFLTRQKIKEYFVSSTKAICYKTEKYIKWLTEKQGGP